METLNKSILDFSAPAIRNQQKEAINPVAENPYAFVRRFVTSVRAHRRQIAGEYQVGSNALVVRTRPTDQVPQLVSWIRAAVWV